MVVDAAKKSVDPRKYSKQVDWKKDSMERPNVALTRAKKISILDELITAKKKVPGCTDYKKLDPFKPKIFGHYNSSVPRQTPADEIMFTKKSIPSST